jgi:hypothetical protein
MQCHHVEVTSTLFYKHWNNDVIVEMFI